MKDENKISKNKKNKNINYDKKKFINKKNNYEVNKNNNSNSESKNSSDPCDLVLRPARVAGHDNDFLDPNLHLWNNKNKNNNYKNDGNNNNNLMRTRESELTQDLSFIYFVNINTQHHNSVNNKYNNNK